MNFTNIAGHLGADPEVRFTATGQKVTTLRVASRVRKGGKDETIWWRVTVWGEQFDKMISFLKKGSAVMVMGEMSKPEIFNDREGNPQISMGVTAVHLSFSPFGRSDRGAENEQGAKAGSFAQAATSAPQATPEAAPAEQQQSYASFATGSADSNFGRGEAFSTDDVPF